MIEEELEGFPFTLDRPEKACGLERAVVLSTWREIHRRLDERRRWRRLKTAAKLVGITIIMLLAFAAAGR